MKKAVSCALVSLLLMLSVVVESRAALVSYFNDGGFVQSQEASNMRAELVGLGHTPLNFTGTSDAAWASALSVANVLVIPELANFNLVGAGQLSSTTRTNIASFVSGGGTLVIAGEFDNHDTTFLNAVFGYSILGLDVSMGPYALNGSAATGTPFAGGPATLPWINRPFGVQSASLPDEALNLYSDSGETVAFVSQYGAGQVAYVAYDWHESTRPGDWGKVLGSAIAFSQVQAVPEPSTLVIFGLGSLGMAVGAIRRRRKMVM